MTGPALAAALLESFEGIVPKASWGETSYFYNPGRRFANGAYFATIKLSDGPNDTASALSREGVWRLSFGVSKARYAALFGPLPARPAKGGIIAGDWDFTALNRLTPHPVYGWMGWCAMLCPGPAELEDCRGLLNEAHSRAVAGFEARARKGERPR
jgi:hypothetical protein